MSTESNSSAILQPAVADVVSLKFDEARTSEALWRLAMRRLRRDYLTLFAFGILITLTLLSILAPVYEEFAGVNYRSTDLPNKFQDIGAEGHILGTDNLGRDTMARLLYGGRVSLSIGFAAALMSLIIGLSLGVIAGYNVGGRFTIIDDMLMWFITTLNSIPSLFLLIIVAAVFRPSVFNLVVILAVLSWTGTMRLVRGETLSQRAREYIIAAQSVGSGSLRIMFIHIIPNIFSVLVVTLAQDIGGFILTEAALSFLALGVKEPTPSWGNMLENAQSYFNLGPHLAIIPGLLISITVLCLFLVGDGLRDAFDPQAKQGN